MSLLIDLRNNCPFPFGELAKFPHLSDRLFGSTGMATATDAGQENQGLGQASLVSSRPSDFAPVPSWKLGDAGQQ
jgi:hypothetical protein